MAIDYGGKRIGIAVSESGLLATPHSVMPNEGDVVSRLASLADQLGAETLILGLPRRARTTAGEQKFRDLAERLRQQTCKPVVLWDETLSTVEAAERLRDGRRRRSKGMDDIDMYAAAVILQSYLDANQGRQS
ncbi:MAG TPA: Holliday junction resolvase RuvX [Thermoanaerobaculia bacterium]|nr:Holliday junction resolvase RuvX [Thermoanaerobaculia bacterium]